MRELKFRNPFFKYSDKSFSHFSYWGNINHKNEFDESVFTGKSSSNECYRGDDEQYTGLKDKNRKEIYEGDIVSNGYIKFIIKYDNEKAQFTTITNLQDESGKSRFPFTYINQCEIIGNIHENPELLK